MQALVDVFGKMNTVKELVVVFLSNSCFITNAKIMLFLMNRHTILAIKVLYIFTMFYFLSGDLIVSSNFFFKIIIYLTPILLVTCVIIQQLSQFGLIDYVIHKNTTVGLILGLEGNNVVKVK
jgi:hypothetical protein